ncbi:MAG TPA: diguanylate cyclase [Symbiobacteriaceae bacterium]|nr:diguanylate cyclase [Symbiobacteriaceae bacterium]
MRGIWKWLPARFVVPGLMLLYLAHVSVGPSPYLQLLPVLAVGLAAREWQLRGGAITVAAMIPILFFAGWRYSALAVPADLVPHQAFLQTWMIRGLTVSWLAMVLLVIFVSSMSSQARRLDQVNAELRHAQQQLTALHQIALSLSTTLDVTRLLEIILERLGQLWGYHHGAVILYDDAAGELVIAAAREYSVPVGTRGSADAGICGTVFQTGRPEIVGDVTIDPRYIPGIPGARSELAVPLIWEGRTVGVLNVESTDLNAYGQSDLDVLTTVAEQAAAAIGNARLHQKTRDLAITDPHTGLFNYRHFQDRLALAVRDAQLMATQTSLLMLDLDFFKRCNDMYGHPTGDAVLQQFARVLSESCRADDLVFRYGGEEFSVILPGASEETAVRVAERIRQKAGGHRFTTLTGRPLDFQLTVSIGVACYPRDGLSHVDLLIAADTALYAAKTGGRNRVVAAAPALHP